MGGKVGVSFEETKVGREKEERDERIGRIALESGNWLFEKSWSGWRTEFAP